MRTLAKLLGWPAHGQARASALCAARAKREAAIAEYRKAKERDDSRRVHEALKALRHATTDLVKLELGA